MQSSWKYGTMADGTAQGETKQTYAMRDDLMFLTWKKR